MKRYIQIIMLASILLLTGCSLKQTCDYCGEEKFCSKYDIIGTTRYICKECLASNDYSVSSNVYSAYVAEPIDPELIGSPSPEPTSTASNDQESTPSTELETPSTPALTPSTSLSRDAALSLLAALLAAQSYSISPDENDVNHYDIYAGSSDTGIDIIFSYDNLGRLKASVTKTASTAETDYASCCICSILAFTNSTDFSGTGFEIYNTTTAHGNYTFGDCRFYFSGGNVSETSEITESFDISFR